MAFSQLDNLDPKKPIEKFVTDSPGFDFLRFQVPFAMSISGPSQSGKSEFIANLVKFREILFSSKFCRIIYCQPESLYAAPNPIFEKIRQDFLSAELFYGLPSLAKLQLENNTLPVLLILDDLMNEVLNSNQMIELFSVHVHHRNISCIFTLQNYFAPSRFGKTISRNVHYKILFYNRIELSELNHMSLQIMPKNPNFLLYNFQFLEKHYPNKFSHYIVIDGHGKSKAGKMHIRSQIFPDEEGIIKPLIFFPKL